MSQKTRRRITAQHVRRTRALSVPFLCFSRAVLPMETQAATGWTTESTTTCPLRISWRWDLSAKVAISCDILDAISTNTTDGNEQDAKPLTLDD
jgi:hypothetical protein